MSQAVLGKGVELYRGDGASPEVFAKIAEMLDIPEEPSTERALVDVTNHDSPGTDREFILGLGDGVEIAARCNYFAGSSQEALFTDKIAGTAVDFYVRYPMFTPVIRVTFTALVRKVTPKTPIDAQATLEFTLKTTGTPVRSTE